MPSEVTIPLPKTEADVLHIKRIWKAFWVLLVLTILELSLGLLIYNIDLGADPNEHLVLAIKGAICIFTLAKAFYIISIFMHLGDEIRNMVMIIALPMTLFIWFITAFISDGASYRNLRNTDGGSRTYKEQKEQYHHPLVYPAEKSEKRLN
ncbi:MAG TPA: cytochrome C oxidase subunit IV family protein [Hanamia sp.]|nr:cytochrome C oxidase subunit IV family protein [Hanamia sp.]